MGLVALVYGRSAGHGFVNIDDHIYVVANPHVFRGLTWDSAVWAFSTFHGSNWHPLTWLSHMLDVELFGLDPGMHHLVAVVLHALNTVLLFGWLRSTTSSTWRAAVVAALFGVHPLHVESVAWISERKDLLSTLFWLLTMIAYVTWVRRRDVGLYLATAGFLALGLASKPMVVTLPFALLLLDFWPLGRLGGLAPGNAFRPGRIAGLVVEKIPFFVLVTASSVVTWLAQRDSAAVRVGELPLGSRLANAVIAYATYLGQSLWPAGLAAFYPHPAVVSGGHGALRIYLATAVLAVITCGALRFWRTRPYLAWGWLWYAGTLVPVIGVVQVGAQAHADRYTYIPLIGILIAATWLVASFLPSSRRAHAGALAAAAVLVTAYAVVAFVQVGYWKDSETLWRRTLDVTSDNWQAWKGLGDALLESDRPAEALKAHEEALRILPGDGGALNGIGVALGKLGRLAEAVGHFEKAARNDPTNVEVWHNLGIAYGMSGDHRAAAAAFEQCVKLYPEHVAAWANLVVARAAEGNSAGAAEALLRLDALDPVRAAAMRR